MSPYAERGGALIPLFW